MVDGTVSSPLLEEEEKNLHYAYLINAGATALLWVCFVSHGFQAPGILDGFYELQAHALAHGQISITPGPLEVFYHDSSLYDGRYYFYWGLMPSIIYLGLEQIIGRIAAHYLTVFGFLFALVYFFQLLIALLVDSACRETSGNMSLLRWTAFPLLWLFLFNLPLPPSVTGFFFSRFSIYEQQILFGLAFVMPALYLCAKALVTGESSHICLASFLFGLAAWTRGTWLILAAMSIPAALLFSVKFSKEKDKCTIFRLKYGWLAGSTVMVLGLFLLNYARFGSITDFGLTHQNPQVYEYLRNQVRLFSPEAKVWDLIFKLVSYYGSPALVKYLSGTNPFYWEGFPPSFFYFNPQFVIVAAAVPFALYKAKRSGSRLLAPLVLIGFITVYLSLLIAGRGTVVVMRYFVEFYYFLILFFFIVTAFLFRYRIAFLITALMISVYLPSNALSFVKTRPELRLLDLSRGFQGITDAAQAFGTFFIERDVVWFNGSVSAQTFQRSRRYNTVGIGPASGGFLQAMDVAAAYIIPDPPASPATQRSVVSIKHLACHSEGAVAVFIDGRPVGRMDVKPGIFVSQSFPVDFPLNTPLPRQVLLAFFPDKQEYLSHVPPGRPALVLREIELTAPGKTGASENLDVKPVIRQ